MADGHRFENLLGESSDLVGAETGARGTGGHAANNLVVRPHIECPSPRICQLSRVFVHQKYYNDYWKKTGTACSGRTALD